MKAFLQGFKAMIAITPGIIPYGAVMGSVTSEAHINLSQSSWLNLLVYSGTAQLAVIDLMSKHTPLLVVVCTGLIINLRFLLYSAALSPALQHSSLLTKLAAAHLLTDQSFAVMSANEQRLSTARDTLAFYFGASICMALSWNLSVVAGMIFGNFAPGEWALEYAVPLSLVTLLIPSLKNKLYVGVAIFSAIASIVLKPVPFNLGLVITAVLAILIGIYWPKKKALP